MSLKVCSLNILLHFDLFILCTWVGKGHICATVHAWRSEYKIQESVLSFLHGGPRNWNQDVNLGGKHLPCLVFIDNVTHSSHLGRSSLKLRHWPDVIVLWGINCYEEINLNCWLIQEGQAYYEQSCPWEDSFELYKKKLTKPKSEGTSQWTDPPCFLFACLSFIFCFNSFRSSPNAFQC